MAARSVASRVCSALKDEGKRSTCYRTMVRVLSGDPSAIDELKRILTPEERKLIKERMEQILREMGGG
jgi:DNA-directed RNA polymerase subunit F